MSEGAVNSIREQACEWIARLDSRDPSAEDLAELRQWMGQSREHATEIRKMATLWSDLNVLTELAVPHESDAVKPATRPVSSPARLMYRFAIAACLIVAVGLVSHVSHIGLPGFGESHVYHTRIGEQRRLTLGDGSTVMLNTNSRLIVDYQKDRRIVRLDHGQAHFDINKDPQRPFLVYTPRGVVRAVGTAFSVYIKSEALDVTVTEGTVAFGLEEKITAELAVQPAPAAFRQATGLDQLEAPDITFASAGEKVVASTGTTSLARLEPEQLDVEQSWQEGILRFSGEPLATVVQEISRYTSQTIIIEDPQLRDLKFGGRFKIGETEKLFTALESGFGVRVNRRRPDLVVLESRSI